MNVHELEARLGHRFSRSSLLEQALTHRSFGTPHNERLEYLGDSVLNCLVAALLFDAYPDLPEGDLSRMRANMVNQNALAQIASTLQLGDVLRLGEGELKSGGAMRGSTLSDALEALIGAIFLDAGFERAQQVVRTLFLPMLRDHAELIPGKDAKTRLQEWLQARHLPLPKYHVSRIEGAAHQQKFFVECHIESADLSTSGSGASRRLGEQDAATAALQALLASSTGHVK